MLGLRSSNSICLGSSGSVNVVFTFTQKHHLHWCHSAKTTSEMMVQRYLEVFHEGLGLCNHSQAKLQEMTNTQSVLLPSLASSTWSPVYCGDYFYRSSICLDEKAFMALYTRYINLNTNESINWAHVQPPDACHIKNYDDLCMPAEKDIISALSKLVIFKFNGDIGKSMNFDGTKSLIKVRNDKSFLEICLQQIDDLNVKYNCDVPLVLMNSFKTDQDTEEFLKNMPKTRTQLFTFQQNRFPRLSEETGLLIPDSCQISGSRDPKWYVPGDGDVFRCLQELGLLKTYSDEGKKWIFLSDIDNLGATPDPAILCWLEEQEKCDATRIDFLMEVAERTSEDKKEGTLILYNGTLKLLDLSQVSEEHVKDIVYSEQFKIVNTNSIWINIKALQNLLNTRLLEMDLIVNRKTMKNNTRTIQLEEFAASAISSFEKAIALKVPRKRMLSVKSISDLLLLRSDIFETNRSGLTLSPRRKSLDLPIIKLGSRLKSIEDLQRRIPSTPSMINLSHLTLSGDIYFENNVTLKGSVKILAKNNETIVIPEGTVLENQVAANNPEIPSSGLNGHKESFVPLPSPKPLNFPSISNLQNVFVSVSTFELNPWSLAVPRDRHWWMLFAALVSKNIIQLLTTPFEDFCRDLNISIVYPLLNLSGQDEQLEWM
nr:UTP glucose 1 phosphate uridylyltransferase [Hymenolepis microstoma]